MLLLLVAWPFLFFLSHDLSALISSFYASFIDIFICLKHELVLDPNALGFLQYFFSAL